MKKTFKANEYFDRYCNTGDYSPEMVADVVSAIDDAITQERQRADVLLESRLDKHLKKVRTHKMSWLKRIRVLLKGNLYDH